MSKYAINANEGITQLAKIELGKMTNSQLVRYKEQRQIDHSSDKMTGNLIRYVDSLLKERHYSTYGGRRARRTRRTRRNKKSKTSTRRR
jgi:hypothetical protein